MDRTIQKLDSSPLGAFISPLLHSQLQYYVAGRVMYAGRREPEFRPDLRLQNGPHLWSSGNGPNLNVYSLVSFLSHLLFWENKAVPNFVSLPPGACQGDGGGGG